MTVNLKPLDSFVTNTSEQFIIDDKFIDDLSYNLGVISSSLNSHEAQLYISLSGLATSSLVGNVIAQTFEYISSSFTIEYNDIISDASTTFPLGYYLKSEAVPLLTIDKIVDSDLFVKMKRSEREFLDSLLESANLETLENFGISSLRIQIDQNAPLNELVRFTSGRTISISQILSDDNIPELRFESTVPLKYFHLNSYAVIPIKPDPSNPYRYKVRSGPYIYGTLRVYLNTHRLPDDIIDQSLYSIGEFRFKSSVTRSDLPGVSDSKDIIFCDFDIPLFESPSSEDDETVGWWAYLKVDDVILSADNPAAVLSFQTDNIINISGVNTSDDTVDFGDVVSFSIDETEIDHNNLKNYVADEHHASSSDDQNIWSTIETSTYYDDTNPTSEGSILPSTTDSTLAINSYNGIKAESAGSSINLSIPDDIRINRTIYEMGNANGNYSAIRLFNSNSLVVGDWVGIRASSAISGQGTLVKLDATDFDDIRNPLGVVVEVDGSDVLVAYEGIIDSALAGASLGSSGDEMYVDEALSGNITSIVPVTPGNYQLRIGTIINNNGSNFMLIRFTLPVILI